MIASLKRTYFQKLYVNIYLPKMWWEISYFILFKIRKGSRKKWIISKICNVVAHLGVLKGTVLQTAKGKIVNTGQTWTTMQKLLDTGSQRTYLTVNLCKHLKLETVQTENVIKILLKICTNQNLKSLMFFNLKSNVMRTDVFLLKHSQQTLNVDSTLIYVEITSRRRLTWYPRWFNVDLSTLIHR